MPKIARPLRILVVSPETAVVRDLAWMLTAVGYEVETSRNVAPNAAWRQYSSADFLIFDGRNLSDPAQSIQLQASTDSTYRIVLYDPAAPQDLSAWFAAGSNDALRVPISRGELLARIRAGARFLEFQRRMQSQSTRNPRLDVYSIRGFLRRLNKFSIEGNSVTLGHTLIATEIDCFADLCRELGAALGRQVMSTLTSAMRQCVGSNALVASLGSGQLAALLPGRKVAEAKVIADQLAQTFDAAQAGLDLRAPLTLATAIVPWRVGITPAELLEQGRETLQIVKQSGGDAAIEQGDYASELANWQSELTAGSPFANVIAQDIMEPFPAVLQRETANRAVLSALRRSGVPVWPFVDSEGRLVGVSTPPPADGLIVGERSSDSQPVVKPATIAHNAAFPEIYEAFSTQGCMTLVVVNDDRPVGYLTCNDFLSLLEPVNSATFASEEHDADDLRSLIVGSVTPQLEPSSASGN